MHGCTKAWTRAISSHTFRGNSLDISGASKGSIISARPEAKELTSVCLVRRMKFEHVARAKSCCHRSTSKVPQAKMCCWDKCVLDNSPTATAEPVARAL